ncbi:MAG: ABC transporter permease [Bacteroidales bacterium]|jgi:ABC-2 type transport system permease protein|nr:ABC transporter permease [Bacteroidales bacterium]
MRIILALVKKEFLQIFRNPVLWKLVTFLPIAQLLIFPFAADLEIKELKTVFIDHDNSSFSRSIRRSLEETGYFKIVNDIKTCSEAEYAMEKNKADIIIEIPVHCQKKIYRKEKPAIAVTANGINSMKASVGVAYLQQFFMDFLQINLQNPTKNIQPTSAQSAQIDVFISRWFNRKMDYKNIFVPGILAVLVSMIGAMLSTLNIVREKELGTIEQINISPISKGHFFAGKMIPFFIIGMAEFGIGLLIMIFLFGISIQGSPITLLLFTAVFLLAMLGLGFMVSIFAKNQVQSMFVIIFLFVVFILLSGLFTPLDSMPHWARTLNLVNPIAHFIVILKSIILKGSTLFDLRYYLTGISLFALIVNSIMIVFYKNRIS